MRGICVILGFLAAVSAPPPHAVDGEISLIVTRGFKRPPLVEKTARTPVSSVLDLLRGAAAVETAFGGAFVERIDGVPGKGDRNGGRAWLYYVNGMIAQKGAGDCAPRGGDVIQWDYHRWEGVSQVPALVGAYPQPLRAVSRERSLPVLIARADSMKGKAEELRASLLRRAVPDARTIPLSAAEVPAGAPVVALGPWGEIVRMPAVREAAARSARGGLFVSCDQAGMRVLDLEGRPRLSRPRAGAIAAVPGGTAPLWLVTGTDDAAAASAADILIASPERIRGLAAAVIEGETVHPAPFTDE